MALPFFFLTNHYTNQLIDTCGKLYKIHGEGINATFPDCVKEGTPEEIKNEYCRKVFISEKVLEAQSNENKIIRPHFRRGYFKRLSSDFYKNKKGQIVFVHETIVNGVAKTLEEK